MFHVGVGVVICREALRVPHIFLGAVLSQEIDGLGVARRGGTHAGRGAHLKPCVHMHLRALLGTETYPEFSFHIPPMLLGAMGVCRNAKYHALRYLCTIKFEIFTFLFCLIC